MTRNEAIKLLTDTEAFVRRICAEYNTTIDEPKYRPFKGSVECWEEMQKHKPLGWAKHRHDHGDYTLIIRICTAMDFNQAFYNFTFADGTPFGIKEG